MQIEELQKEAEVVRSREVAGVIERIQEAIQHYGLTAADLFGSARRGRKTGRKALAVAEKPTKRRTPKVTSAKGTKVSVKYRDDRGNSWTGRGSTPRWLKAAIEGGRSLDNFLVNR
jgi:DNA-binding protein H-NS